MEAGRELDALVAEKFMGYKLTRWINHPSYEPVIIDDGSGRYLPIGLSIPNYSTNIAAAWQVVEKLAEIGYSVRVTTTKYLVLCVLPTLAVERGEIRVDAQAAPLAICLAALKALNVSTN